MQSQTFRRQMMSSNPKKNVLFANNSLSYIQLGQLQKSVSELVHQNKTKYAKICESKADFRYQLYKIGDFQAHSKAFSKQLLMRQMDRLLEQKNYLDRELSLIRFRDQEQKNEKEYMVSSQAEHFELLKSIWRRDGHRSYEGTLEHIEELNLMVGQIKCNIQSLIKFQANDHKQNNQAYLKTFSILQDKNRQCQKCNQIQAKNDYLKEKLAAIEDKMNKATEQNIAYLEEINAKEDKIKKLTKSQIKQETQLKDKIIRLEQELLKKDHQIKTIKKELQQYSSNKFANQSEGYDLIIKGSELDLSRFHKKINISCETLLQLITHEVQSQLKVSQPAKARQNSGRSKADSTQGSNNSHKELTKESPESNELKQQQTRQNLCLQVEHEERERIGDVKNSHQRYVRTSKRSSMSGSMALYQQKVEGFLSANRRGGPSYGTGTE